MITDFYDPPSLEGFRHGDLIRARPVFVPQLTAAAGAFQILYVSTNSRSELIPVSGIVVIPEEYAAPGTNALLLFSPGFRGLGGAEVPSRLLVTGNEPADSVAGIEAALRRGWVVAVPDGEGLGVWGTGPHTFLAARAAARVTLDLACAVYRSADLDTPVAPCVAWGYADGGRAVAAAGEMHPWYAPELDLRGVAAGAVVSDLGALAPLINRGGPAAGLGLAAVVGLARAYEQLPLRHVLTEEGALAAAEAARLPSSELLREFPQPLSHWCRRLDPWNDVWWRRVLALETLAHVGLAMPLHLYHGTRDDLVPVRAGQRALIAYRQRGTTVTWREYDAGHRATAVAAIGDVLARLGEDLTDPVAAAQRRPSHSEDEREGERPEHAPS
ncbi:lipase family protein [Nocardia sp. NPDC004068]|uniref:lipase family protein n=1 Tax=Nocardia sp. NPDC004068 TaxID=3364303 RepID=UPI003678C93E